MQFGIFDHIEGIPGTSLNRLLRDRIDLIKIADAAGFAGYHLAEHHGSDLCLAPNQEIFLAAAAEQTSTIRLGPMIKILPVHHPLRVIEDICLLDQLTGGRVEYGIGRGAAAIEHFWFEGDWFACNERFDEALALILQGLQTGKVDSSASKHYDFPPIELSMTPFQHPNPPFWYPGNPVTAGRYGFQLLWSGPIPTEAYELYLSTWEKYKDDPIRANAPGAKPRVGSTIMVGIGDTEAEGRDIAKRAYRGLMRRVVHVHTFDPLALDPVQVEQALNPIARGAMAIMAPGGEAILDEITQNSGTASQVRDHLVETYADGRTDYLVLQLPTGDMTFAEAKRTLQVFIDEVMPALV